MAYQFGVATLMAVLVPYVFVIITENNYIIRIGNLVLISIAGDHFATMVSLRQHHV